jgi:hypothetical protein
MEEKKGDMGNMIAEATQKFMYDKQGKREPNSLYAHSFYGKTATWVDPNS